MFANWYAEPNLFSLVTFPPASVQRLAKKTGRCGGFLQGSLPALCRHLQQSGPKRPQAERNTCDNKSSLCAFVVGSRTALPGENHRHHALRPKHHHWPCIYFSIPPLDHFGVFLTLQFRYCKSLSSGTLVQRVCVCMHVSCVCVCIHISWWVKSTHSLRADVWDTIEYSINRRESFLVNKTVCILCKHILLSLLSERPPN